MGFSIFSNGNGKAISSFHAKNGKLIELRKVNKAYRTPAGDFCALREIDLQVDQGEFVTIVGKSDAGKSTLVNMVTGIDRPTNGEVIVGNQLIHNMSEANISTWRGQNVGVIFQFFKLLPRISCAQNVMLPMDFADLYNSPSQRRERALDLLDQVGIADHADKLPSAVSGGERQRVAIARALANDPDVLVADEPTGNLDSKTANEVFSIFEKLVDSGKTILMVTHDKDLAERSHRIVKIGDGRIIQDATPEDKPKLLPNLH